MHPHTQKRQRLLPQKPRTSMKTMKSMKQFPGPINGLRIGTDCSGIEAPIMALQQMGIPHEHVFSCEIDPIVCETVQMNYSPKRVYTNIVTRNHHELPEMDMYVCGFPCQSFSSESAGKRKGFQDPTRGTIFFHCLEVIKLKHPKLFVLENVKGILTLQHTQHHTVFETILAKLHQLKQYHLYHSVLNTKDYNLPQNRERVYIVGIRKDCQQRPFQFPAPVPLTKTIMDMVDVHLPSAQRMEYSNITPHMQQVIDHAKINPKENWVINVNTGYEEFATKMLNVSPCLLAGNSAFYVTSLQRKLTEREALRLQGFPDSFKIDGISKSKIYKMAGNSMSVNVLMALFTEIFKAIA